MIYLVEDDNSIRELVIYTLQSTGFEARGFACGADFWEGMKEDMPELVLLDIMLPDEDGLSILRKLRGTAATQKLPVMMLTAKEVMTHAGGDRKPDGEPCNQHDQAHRSRHYPPCRKGTCVYQTKIPGSGAEKRKAGRQADHSAVDWPKTRRNKH